MTIPSIQNGGSMWSSYPGTRGVQGVSSRPQAEAPSQQGVQAQPVADLPPQQQVAPVSTGQQQIASMSDEDLTAWLYDQVDEMTADSLPQMAAAATATSAGSLAEMYKFSNQYLYGAAGKTWTNIDADQDGKWSRAEVDAYAAAYEKAFGRTIDVDTLFQTYANADGYIYGDKQLQIYQNDDLGIDYAKDTILMAEYNFETGGTGNIGGGSSSSGVNQAALNDFINKYTYGSGNKLYAKIDQNEDGVWTKDELVAYAKAYEKATGKKLDVETLWAKYDRDGNGVLKYQEQNEMYADDALGLSHIADLMNSQTQGGGSTNNSGNDNTLSNMIKDAIGNMNSSSLRSLASALSQGMQKATMLDMFMTATFAMNNRYGMMGGFGGMGSNQAAYVFNLGLMNLFV